MLVEEGNCEGYITKLLPTSNPLAMMRSFSSMYAQVNSQRTSLNKRFFTLSAFERSFISMDALVSGEIGPATKGLESIIAKSILIIPLYNPPNYKGKGERLVDYLDAPDRLVRECPFDYERISVGSRVKRLDRIRGGLNCFSVERNNK